MFQSLRGLVGNHVSLDGKEFIVRSAYGGIFKNANSVDNGKYMYRLLGVDSKENTVRVDSVNKPKIIHSYFDALEILKGKGYEDGLEKVKNMISENELFYSLSYENKDYVDICIARKDNNNWICFSAPYIYSGKKENKVRKIIIDYSNGYWNAMKDNKYKENRDYKSS